ncbi:conserved hypothetical protein [Aeropyrum pernix]|uniref:CYTH domain-containing protein n=1 Tax=Aeropyrum pernix TaxID=56636 RepID=A0A401H8E4_AERPX|nr:class IV adenylate cyclase [Aeropyrum pernix]GBF08697.1 conserved hypothetical protein [Aeropyrum pernix]
MVGGVEVESKYRIECGEIEYIEAALRDAGLYLEGERLEVDIYYRHPCRDMLSRDEALRLRVYEDDGGRLTYKGPRMGGSFKAREEVEIELTRVEEARLLLARLGFEETLVVRKRRKYYRGEGVLVTLDNVESLGCFIEVEAEDPGGIVRLESMLKLEDRRVDETYAEMALKNMDRRGDEAHRYREG